MRHCTLLFACSLVLPTAACGSDGAADDIDDADTDDSDDDGDDDGDDDDDGQEGPATADDGDTAGTSSSDASDADTSGGEESGSTTGNEACRDVDGGAAPLAEPIALVGEAASFDDLRYSAELGRVLAIPQGHATVYLVDPDTLEVTAFGGLTNGIASVDAGMDRLFVADRGGQQIIVLDAQNGEIVGVEPLTGHPDYVRVSLSTSEVWVTEPSSGRIEVLLLANDEFIPQGDIAVPGGPEGLVFTASGDRAFAQIFSGALAVIDVEAREVVDTWPTGCSGAHGIPVVDEARGIVFAGCSSDGGGVMLDADDGEILASPAVGSGEAILAYAPALGHFYLRGDPGTDVALFAVCDDRTLGLLGTATTATHGHGMAADDRGNVWVCDADNGGLLRIVDPSAR